MIDFNKMEQNELPNFHNGNGIIKTNMFFDGKNKIMRTVIEKVAQLDYMSIQQVVK